MNTTDVKVIAFEGSDGCGKSSQIQLLESEIKYVINADLDPALRDLTVISYQNPGGTDLGKFVRKELLTRESLSNRERLQGMLMALVSVAEQIKIRVSVSRSLLPKGRTIYVLLDRWVLSTLIYQAFLARESIYDINAVIQATLGPMGVEPSMYLVYQITPETAWSRIGSRGEDKTVFEKRESIQRIANAYNFADSLVKSPVISIDGTPDIQTVWRSTQQAVFLHD
jgi:dTMP kinase